MTYNHYVTYYHVHTTISMAVSRFTSLRWSLLKVLKLVYRPVDVSQQCQFTEGVLRTCIKSILYIQYSFLLAVLMIMRHM